MSRRYVMLTCVLLTASLSPSADEGRIPIFVPTVINQPGSYFVSRPITSNVVIVTINASGVVLDLNDMTLTNTTDFNSVIVLAAGVSDVVIRNGRIVRGFRGIHAPSVGDLVVEGIDFTGTAAAAVLVESGQSVSVLNNTMTNCGGGPGADFIVLGVTAAAGYTGGRIVGNEIVNTPYVAIDLTNLVQAQISDNRIIGAYLTSCIGVGIRMSGGRNNDIERNVIRQSGCGIFADGVGSRIRGNLLSEIDECAISTFTDGNEISENVVRDTGDGFDCPQGIQVGGSFNTVRSNTVTNVRGDGILISGSNNMIDNNVSEGHIAALPVPPCGVRFNNGNAHVYRGNMLRGNIGGGACGVLAGNTSSGNFL
jgi:parallel beta-helix repeat protein